MQAKPRVLIIENATSTTGAFKSICAVVDLLQEKVEFFFALPKKSSLDRNLRQRGFEVISIPFLEISKSLSVIFYFPKLIVNSLALARFVSKKEIGIVHVNDLYNLTGVGVKLLRPKTQLIYHVRLLPDSYVGAMYSVLTKIIMRFADHVVCNSYTVKARLNVVSPKVEVIYNLPPDEPVSNTVKPKEFITLLYLANYTLGKGHQFAIEALAIAKEKNPRLRMIMAGGTFGNPANEQLKRSLITLAKERKVESMVEFRDFQKDVKALMDESTIFLNFSESESFSRTCLEALYYGVPVISTNSGGPQEFILNNQTGFIVMQGNITEMAERITLLASDEGRRQEFIDNGRQLLDIRFNREAILSRYLNIYNGPMISGLHHYGIPN